MVINAGKRQCASDWWRKHREIFNPFTKLFRTELETALCFKLISRREGVLCVWEVS